MANFGKIENFDMEKEQWGSYIERVELYFKANKVAEDNKAAILLTCIGSQAYNLIRDLCTPVKPAEKTYPEVIQLLTGYLNPKPSTITERYKFHNAKQTENESVGQFITRLKKLSAFCEFGVSLEDTMRDRLVCGLKDEKLKKRLLSELTLTYAKAVEITLSWEATEKNAMEMRQEPLQMHKISKDGGAYGNAKPFSRRNFQTEQEKAEQVKECYVCGRNNHRAFECRYKEFKCHNCGKKGHLKNVCRAKSKLKSERKGAYHLTRDSEEESEIEVADGGLFNLSDTTSEPVWVTVQMEGKPFQMEVDTGSPVSVISEKCYKQNFNHIPIKETKLKLQMYIQVSTRPIGFIEVTVNYKNKVRKYKLYVIQDGGPPLMGRQWFFDLDIDLKELCRKGREMHYVGHREDNQKIIDKLFTLFPHIEAKEREMGTCTIGKFKLGISKEAKPIAFKPRPLPYAMKESVELELAKLEEMGILTKVETSEWCTPIVPILKEDGSIRICGDYKVTINPVLEKDNYPLPPIEDLFAELQGGKTFSVIDLKNSYQQVLLEQGSKKYVTICTHKGLYEYNRLPYGITSGPGKFQRLMEHILQGLKGVCVFLDDILVTGESEPEHIARLKEVFSRLDKAGLKIRRDKCKLFKRKVEYLGYAIDEQGLHTTTSKVEAIVKAPVPVDRTQVKSFVGLVNYYGRFVKNLSALLVPLYNLLKKENPWNWTEECQQVFEKVKQIITSAEVLAHYNPRFPVSLSCDASGYGVGAVISHRYPDGKERPIAYASRTLSKHEKQYSQIDKEGLAIIFGITKFHQYLFGRRFVIITDHKPLISIFGPKKGIPHMMASRLQRWTWILSGYDYEIEFKKSEDHSNADCLSRLPLKETLQEKSLENNLSSYLLYVESSPVPVDSKKIKKETRTDKELSKVQQYIQEGWPKTIEPELKPYWVRRDQLYMEQGCVMWGYRVIVPHRLREVILEELHWAHTGVVRMKALARSYFWWPSVDQAIEGLGKSCESCAKQRPNPSKSELHVWKFPVKPWYRVHADFLGPYQGHMYLLIIDAYTKWVEIFEMSNIMSSLTISKMRETFARFGFPKQLLTDNGPQFVLEEFEQFCLLNGIRHLTSAPYHPSSNGLAENAVKNFKRAMSCMLDKGVKLEEAVQKYLLYSRITPHSTTQDSPAKLMFGREITTRLDLLKPSVQKQVEEKQVKQILDYGGAKQKREFEVGLLVMARDYKKGSSKWKKGKIKKKISEVVFEVEMETGQIWKRHVDQMFVHQPKEMVKEERDSEASLLDSRMVGLEMSQAQDNDSIGLEISKAQDNDSIGQATQVEYGQNQPEMRVEVLSQEKGLAQEKKFEMTSTPKKVGKSQEQVSEYREVQEVVRTPRYPRRVRKPKTIFEL